MKWEILHIPDNPPLTNQQSTADVFASEIDPRLANTLVGQLNQVAPLENLRHVKRVRKSIIEGKAQLSVILCLSLGHDNQLDIIPNDVLKLINEFQLHPFITKVAKCAASSKEEWKEQCKLWPTSYHPPVYNIDGITGFSEEESQLVYNFMKAAIEFTKSGLLDDRVVNAAVIVDPSTKQVIASACDQTCVGPPAANKGSLENTSSIEQTEITPSHYSDANDVINNEPLHLDRTHDEYVGSYSGVACLFPWRWAEDQHCTQKVDCGTTNSWHPLRHAALVAIECAAARDRCLFPSSGLTKCQTSHMDNLQFSPVISPAKRQKTQLSKEDDTIVEAPPNGLHNEATRPYLCTGFDIYLVWEPCTMCAMALVHQRIRRIFYAFPNRNTGALGSVHRLQGEKSLNHHYAVFRVLLPEEVIGKLILTESGSKPWTGF
ncbi:cytidine/deoxycytidylate deaminase family protein isoform X2 [Tasmannia lanceolata]|uniref:cytidine/deoxycytidylate deaminase family protein isoform X2 n=1 Tax=Tasmannia lanceolata TaxID=3420 RepID=UPI0040634A7F